MLSVNQVSKSYNLNQVLDRVSFSLKAGEKLGLVGPNGCGKTTLLRILVGEDLPDSGSFSFTPSDLSRAYLPQGLSIPDDLSIDQYLMQACQLDGDLEDRLLISSQQIAEDPTNTEKVETYHRILTMIEKKSQMEPLIQKIVSGLGLDQIDPQLPVHLLSGGQKTRLALAGTLLHKPHLLLLDEPTNHLDIEMLEWLENWIINYSGGVLLVSHDRVFIDRVCTTILEIDPVTKKTKLYEGNYSSFLEEKAREQEKVWISFHDQQKEIRELKAAAMHLRGIAKFRVGGKADSGDKFARGFFANRGKGTMGRAVQIEHKLEKLLTEDRIDKPKAGWQLKVEFNDSAETGRDVLVCEDLTVGYSGRVLLQNLNLVLHFGSRCCLLGPNGSGKTSFIRTILGQIDPLHGRFRLGSRVKPGYMQQDQSSLLVELNALQFIQSQVNQNETAARTFLHKYLFSGDEVFVPIAQLSYGERARLMMATMAASGCNFLILDEPLNHLDIPSRNRFEQALTLFEGTVLVVVHDRYFIHQFATEVWEITGDQIRIN